MVQFYTLSSIRKLFSLTSIFYRGSKRILRTANPPSHSISSDALRRVDTTSKFDIALRKKSPLEYDPMQDSVYYSVSDTGYCVFQVENTIFKLHRVLLTREPSAFGDMFSLAKPNGIDSTSSDTFVFLSDTLEKFRDFLWALYASHTELYNETQINRLLNIAELSNKYCFVSLEGWVLERIYILSQETVGPLRSASLDVCARMLTVAILCNHRKLLDLITQHLICQILWYNVSSDVITEIAETHGLQVLRGVGYYRQLIDMEFSNDNSDIIKPCIPVTMSLERRMCFLSAHNSLLNIWDRLRKCPPTIFPSLCLSHVECSIHWEHMWFEAVTENETVCGGSADVLGRLKAVMLSLRNLLCNAPGITLQCKLAALEAITALRDEIIDGLMDHFTGHL